MKICFACKEEKSLSEYSVNRAKSDGLSHKCRDCIKLSRGSDYSKRSNYINLSPHIVENERARKKRYKKNNPDVVAASNRRTYVKRKNLRIECSNKEVRIFMEENTFCVQCGSTEELTLDHIIPVSWENLSRHNIDNFQVLCNSCNGTKSARSSIDLRPIVFLDTIDVLAMLK